MGIRFGSIACALAVSASRVVAEPRSFPDTRPVETQVPNEDLQSLLSRLRARLDVVRSAPPDDGRGTWMPAQLSALRGVRRSEIEGALGPPDGDTQDHVVYYFYRLPEDRLGGGAELRISYASDGRLATAEWNYTR